VRLAWSARSTIPTFRLTTWPSTRTTTLFIQAGVRPAKVAHEAARLLEETMRTYAHFLPGGNREDAEVLASLLGRTHVSAKRVFSGLQRPRTATKLRVVGGNV
jgi:hypothetical protein